MKTSFSAILFAGILGLSAASFAKSSSELSLQDSFSEKVIAILSTEILQMSCDQDKIEKSLQVGPIFLSSLYNGEASRPCLRQDSLSFPFYQRHVSLRMQTDYKKSALESEVTPRHIVRFSGQTSFPDNVYIEESQLKKVAAQIWNQVRSDLVPAVQTRQGANGALVVELTAEQSGIGFILNVSLESLAQGLSTDALRPLVSIEYKVSP